MDISFMSELYLTCSEIAQRVGVTNQAVWKRSKSEEWPSRKRKARGGGVEHPISCLPDDWQLIIKEQTNDDDSGCGDLHCQGGQDPSGDAAVGSESQDATAPDRECVSGRVYADAEQPQRRGVELRGDGATSTATPGGGLEDVSIGIIDIGIGRFGTNGEGHCHDGECLDDAPGQDEGVILRGVSGSTLEPLSDDANPAKSSDGKRTAKNRAKRPSKPNQQHHGLTRLDAVSILVSQRELYCGRGGINAVVDCDVAFAKAHKAKEIDYGANAEGVYAWFPTLSRSTLASLRVKFAQGQLTEINSVSKTGPEPAWTDEHIQIIRRFITWSARMIREEMRAAGVEPLPSQATVHRWRQEWIEENPQEHALLRGGEQEWNNNFRSGAGDSAARATHALAIVEMDATPGNLLLLDGRYAILGFVDIYTRRRRYYVAPTVTSAAYVAGLRQFILELGIPSQLRTDRGMAEKSHYITQVANALGMLHHRCNRRSPWEKPFIERSFGILEELLIKLPGYVGRNTVEAGKIRSRGKLLGQPTNVAISATDLQRYLDNWAAEYDNRPQPDALKGLTPLEKWLESARETPIRKLTDERVLDFILAPVPASTGRGPGVRRVGKKGIEIDGASYFAIDGSCQTWVGRDVFVRYDPWNDAGLIHVFHPETNEFLFTAANPELTGMDRQAIAIARTRKANEHKKALKQVIKAVAAANPVNTLPIGTNVVAMPVPAQEIKTEVTALIQKAVNRGNSDAPDYLLYPAAKPEEEFDYEAELARFNANYAAELAEEEEVDIDSAFQRLIVTPVRQWSHADRQFWLKNIDEYPVFKSWISADDQKLIIDLEQTA